jgi:phosphopentomutase
MPRAILLVLDSFGCGGAEDAAVFGDEGADTLFHIAEACLAGGGDQAGLRQGPLRLPALESLGLALVGEASSGRVPPGLARPERPIGQWGYGVERAPGKDTPSGHWEIAGTKLEEAFGYFPDTDPAFPPALTQQLIAEGGLPGILGDRHAAGVAIIDELGTEHMRTAKPICYTSVDSVFQIAAHEQTFGLEHLYDLCRIARRLCDPLQIGRVIARPFIGSQQQGFRRTTHRKDFSIPPPQGTILDRAADAGREIVSIGKIGDIFAHRSTGRELKGAGNMAHFDMALAALATLADGGLIFANFVDFDTDYGHRRDVAGYAHCLESFDARLPQLFTVLKRDDLVVITADHGNDPTWRGTDHTREHVPILCCGPGLAPGAIGRRSSLADIGATIAKHLALAPPDVGTSWL